MTQHHLPRDILIRDWSIDTPRSRLVDRIVEQDAILTEVRAYIDYLETQHPYHAPPGIIGIIKNLKAITKYDGGVY